MSPRNVTQGGGGGHFEMYVRLGTNSGDILHACTTVDLAGISLVCNSQLKQPNL